MEICFENKYVYASRNNTWNKSIYEKQLTLQFFPQFIKGERKRAKKKNRGKGQKPEEEHEVVFSFPLVQPMNIGENGLCQHSPINFHVPMWKKRPHYK